MCRAIALLSIAFASLGILAGPAAPEGRGWRSLFLRPALTGPAAPGAGDPARGTPKIGPSRGLSRDFRQSPASRAPDPPLLPSKPRRSGHAPAAGPARPAGEAAAPPPAGRIARQSDGARGAVSYGLADTVTLRCAMGTAPGCPVFTSRPSPMVSPTSRASRWLGSEPCQAPSGGVAP